MSITTRMRELRASLGIWRLLRVAPQWLVRKRFIVGALSLKDVVPQAPRIPLTVDLLPPDRLADLLPLDSTLDLQDALRRVQSGQVCLIARLEQEIVHYRWIVTTEVELQFLGLTWYPKAGDYTVLRAFTHPGYRNRGIQFAVAQQSLRRAQSMGLKRLVTFVAWWNGASLHVIERLGVVPVGSVTHWNLGLWRGHSSDGAARVAGDRLTVE